MEPEKHYHLKPKFRFCLLILGCGELNFQCCSTSIAIFIHSLALAKKKGFTILSWIGSKFNSGTLNDWLLFYFLFLTTHIQRMFSSVFEWGYRKRM
jgi:hypothetical protein